MAYEGNNFTQPLPEILLNGSTSFLGTIAATVANLDPAIGALSDYGKSPSGDIPGESLTKYTQIRKLGQFIYQYINIPGEWSETHHSLLPSIPSPCTISFNVPAGCVVHYTFGPQYPTAKVDNINCFAYNPSQPNISTATGPYPNNPNIPNRGCLQLDYDKNQEGTYVYAVAFGLINGVVDTNDQSPLLIAKFHINATV